MLVIGLFMAAFGSRRNRVVSAMVRPGVCLVIDHFDLSNSRTGIENIDRIVQKTMLAFRVLMPVKSIHVDGANRADLGNLAAFPELRSLSLTDGDYDSHSFRVLQFLPQLEEFELIGNIDVDEEGARYLRHCPLLRRCSLFAIGNIRGEFLDELACEDRLQYLEMWVDYTEFDDSDLLRLRKFRQLETVKISFGNFNGDGFVVFDELRKLNELQIAIPNDEAKLHLRGIAEVINGD